LSEPGDTVVAMEPDGGTTCAWWTDLSTLIERLDTLLDAIPIYEDGRWWRYGDWGCRLQLHRLWWRMDE
jgi:hypothetical protein